MLFHVFFAIAGFVGPAVLLAINRRPDRKVLDAVIMGVMSGPFCGAGIALGVAFQPTTANIHSGYSFRGPFEWILLAAGGGIVGLAIGAWLGRWSVTWRPAGALLLAFAVVSAAGWVVSGARETIDCDDRPSFCEDRYGDG